MGWWKIRDVETGQVDFEAETAAKTANAIPGEEDTNCLFNGDGPADVMGHAFDDIETLFRNAWGRLPQPDELRACFNFVFNGRLRRRTKEPGNAEGSAAAHI